MTSKWRPKGRQRRDFSVCVALSPILSLSTPCNDRGSTFFLLRRDTFAFPGLNVLSFFSFFSLVRPPRIFTSGPDWIVSTLLCSQTRRYSPLWTRHAKLFRRQLSNPCFVKNFPSVRPRSVARYLRYLPGHFTWPHRTGNRTTRSHGRVGGT